MEPARVTDVEHLGGRVLRVSFSDGLVRELDFAGALPGVLSLIDDDVFPTITIDPIARTVTWPMGVDLDPDVLHGVDQAATGPGPKVLREYHREHARRSNPAAHDHARAVAASCARSDTTARAARTERGRTQMPARCTDSIAAVRPGCPLVPRFAPHGSHVTAESSVHQV